MLEGSAVGRQTQMVRVECRVSGLVQGVFFRAYAKEKAAERGICGAAKNLSDGSVEIVAEGERAAVKDFLKDLREGPPGARVNNLSVVWKEATRDFVDFRILP